MDQLIEKQVKKRVKGEARKRKQLTKAEINKKGQEVLDPQPIYADIGYKEPPSINDRIRQVTLQVQAETAAAMAAQNLSDEDVARILDEEDDFNIPEEYDNRLTSYELQGQMSELQDDPFVAEVEAPPASTPQKEKAVEEVKDVETE